MKSPYCFIIKAVDGRRYDNIRTYGNNEFIVSASQEDHTVSNRFAEVISVPIYYNGPIIPKDIVVVHHNVFKFYYDMRGRQKSSWHHLKDDLFIVEPEQVYLYSNDKENWKALSPFLFIRPIPSEDKIFSPINGLEELWGEVVFNNDDMTEVEVGDIVSFTPDSEYEFRINNEILYRMYNRNICLKK